MYLTMVIRNNMTPTEGPGYETVHIGPDRNVEVEHFLNACKTHISDFDAYTPLGIEDILDNGSAPFDGGVVLFLDLTNTEGFGTATRCVIEILGGSVQVVWGDKSLAYRLLDWDNIKAGEQFSDFTKDDQSWNVADGPISEFIYGRHSDSDSSLEKALDYNFRNNSKREDNNVK